MVPLCGRGTDSVKTISLLFSNQEPFGVNRDDIFQQNAPILPWSGYTLQVPPHLCMHRMVAVLQPTTLVCHHGDKHQPQHSR